MSFDFSKIDTMSYKNDLNSYKRYLEKVDTTVYDNQIKILGMSNYYLHKLYNMVILNETFQKLLIKNTINAVYNGEGLPIILRLKHPRFGDQKSSIVISTELYEMGVRQVLEYKHYFQILKHIIRGGNSYQYNEIWRELRNIFDHSVQAEDQYIRMEIADMFLLYGDQLVGEQLLDIIRRYDNRQDEQLGNRNGLQSTVYKDTQNVHNTSINKSVLKVCYNLLLKEQAGNLTDEELVDIFKELENYCFNKSDIPAIYKVRERIQIDTTFFNYGSDKFTMLQIFCNVWSFITKDKNKEELKKRFVEEMIAMHEYCATGFIARIVNTIQGFTEDPDLCINISDYDRHKAIVLHKLNNLMTRATDNILDDMLTVDKKLFLDYLKNRIRMSEFEDIPKEDFINILTEYTRRQWKFNKDEKLIYLQGMDETPKN